MSILSLKGVTIGIYPAGDGPGAAALGGHIQACSDGHVSRHAGRGRAHELGEGGAMGAAQGPPPEPPPLHAATAGAERRPGRPSPATSAARPGRG